MALIISDLNKDVISHEKIIPLETADISFDRENSVNIYKRYFTFERRKGLEKIRMHLLMILILVIVMIGIGLVIDQDILIYIGSIMAGFTILYLLVYLIRFKIYEKRTLDVISKDVLASEKKGEFSFDEEKIILKTPNLHTEIKWDLIAAYEVNEGDLYLYYHTGDLYNIISDSIIGKDKMEIFRTVISKKVGEPEN
jgi:hypothetical protein